MVRVLSGVLCAKKSFVIQQLDARLAIQLGIAIGWI
jgi:hypothetical protein